MPVPPLDHHAVVALNRSLRDAKPEAKPRRGLTAEQRAKLMQVVPEPPAEPAEPERPRARRRPEQREYVGRAFLDTASNQLVIEEPGDQEETL